MAACAILLGALAPTVSRYLAASYQGAMAAGLLEICVSRPGGPSVILRSAQAGLSANQSAKQPANQPAAPAKMDHCPLCVLHADHAGLPPSAAAAMPLVRLQDVTPSLFLHAPRPLPVWATALARAPPAWS